MAASRRHELKYMSILNAMQDCAPVHSVEKLKSLIQQLQTPSMPEDEYALLHRQVVALACRDGAGISHRALEQRIATLEADNINLKSHLADAGREAQSQALEIDAQRSRGTKLETNLEVAKAMIDELRQRLASQGHANVSSSGLEKPSDGKEQISRHTPSRELPQPPSGPSGPRETDHVQPGSSAHSSRASPAGDSMQTSCSSAQPGRAPGAGRGSARGPARPPPERDTDLSGRGDHGADSTESISSPEPTEPAPGAMSTHAGADATVQLNLTLGSRHSSATAERVEGGSLDMSTGFEKARRVASKWSPRFRNIPRRWSTGNAVFGNLWTGLDPSPDHEANAVEQRLKELFAVFESSVTALAPHHSTASARTRGRASPKGRAEQTLGESGKATTEKHLALPAVDSETAATRMSDEDADAETHHEYAMDAHPPNQDVKQEDIEVGGAPHVNEQDFERNSHRRNALQAGVAEPGSSTGRPSDEATLASSEPGAHDQVLHQTWSDPAALREPSSRQATTPRDTQDDQRDQLQARVAYLEAQLARERGHRSDAAEERVIPTVASPAREREAANLSEAGSPLHGRGSEGPLPTAAVPVVATVAAEATAAEEVVREVLATLEQLDAQESELQRGGEFEVLLAARMKDAVTLSNDGVDGEGVGAADSTEAPGRALPAILARRFDQLTDLMQRIDAAQQQDHSQAGSRPNQPIEQVRKDLERRLLQQFQVMRDAGMNASWCGAATPQDGLVERGHATEATHDAGIQTDSRGMGPAALAMHATSSEQQTQLEQRLPETTFSGEVSTQASTLRGTEEVSGNHARRMALAAAAAARAEADQAREQNRALHEEVHDLSSKLEKLHKANQGLRSRLDQLARVGAVDAVRELREERLCYLYQRASFLHTCRRLLEQFAATHSTGSENGDDNADEHHRPLPSSSHANEKLQALSAKIDDEEQRTGTMRTAMDTEAAQCALEALGTPTEVMCCMRTDARLLSHVVASVEARVADTMGTKDRELQLRRREVGLLTKEMHLARAKLSELHVAYESQDAHEVIQGLRRIIQEQHDAIQYHVTVRENWNPGKGHAGCDGILETLEALVQDEAILAELRSSLNTMPDAGQDVAVSGVLLLPPLLTRRSPWGVREEGEYMQFAAFLFFEKQRRIFISFMHSPRRLGHASFPAVKPAARWGRGAQASTHKRASGDRAGACGRHGPVPHGGAGLHPDRRGHAEPGSRYEVRLSAVRAK